MGIEEVIWDEVIDPTKEEAMIAATITASSVALTSVRERAQAGHAEGAACSLRALLRYAAEESRSAAAAVAHAQAAS